MRRLLEVKQPNIHQSVISAIDRVVVGEVMRHTEGNRVEAALRLGVARNTLRAKTPRAGFGG